MLNAMDESLLVALRQGAHFKANPADASKLLAQVGIIADTPEASSSARRLVGDNLAAFVTDDDRPGRPLLRITDTGIAYADILIAQQRKKTWREKVGEISRSDWMAFGALVVSIIALFKPD